MIYFDICSNLYLPNRLEEIISIDIDKIKSFSSSKNYYHQTIHFKQDFY